MAQPKHISDTRSTPNECIVVNENCDQSSDCINDLTMNNDDDQCINICNKTGDDNNGRVSTQVKDNRGQLKQQQHQIISQDLHQDEDGYFLVYEGSNITHTISTYRKSKDILISIVPQHNIEETVSVSLYKAHRNKKAHKLNEYYNKISRISSDIQLDFIDDGVSHISDDIVDNLQDIKSCYTKLSEFIESMKESITTSIDRKLNLENRLHYLLRFHIDVQYSLGFVIILDPDNLNLDQFNIEKQILLSYLKKNELFAIYKLFDQIYTLGSNYELNMKINIHQNEPSFLFFSTFDNKNFNFIREYSNQLVSHTTSIQNKFLSVDQRICIITNIFYFEPFNTESNPTTLVDNDTLQKMKMRGKSGTCYDSSELLVVGPKTGSLTTINQDDDKNNGLDNLVISESMDPDTNSSTTITEQVPSYSPTILPTSPKYITDYESDIIVTSPNTYNNNTRNKQNFVTIKSSRNTYRADPTIHVNKTSIQKFYSTKFSKVEADIAHERYRPKIKSLVFEDSCFDECSNKLISSSNDLVNRKISCKSNNFLSEFLLKSCSISGESIDNKTITSIQTDDNSVTTTSLDTVPKIHPYIHVHPNNKLTTNELPDIDILHCRSETLCNPGSSSKPQENYLLTSSASNITQSKRSHFKTHNKSNDQQPLTKRKHGTFGHSDKLSPTNIVDRDDTAIREFLDKEITHLDNDTSFKNTVTFKGQSSGKKSPKLNLHFGIFKREKVISDISNNVRATKSKTKNKNNNVQNTSHSPDSKAARLTSLKKFSTSSDIAISSKDNFNRSINCLFANNDIDLKTDANNSILFDVDTWSNIVDPKILKKLGPRETKRQDIIYELIYTENQYLRTLKTLYQVMYKGLQNCVLISSATIDKLMPNLTSLIAVNGRFLADLVAKQNADQNYIIPVISDVFDNQFSGSVGEYMAEIYAQVCLQKRSAVELYKELLKNNKEFNYFVTSCANRPQLKRLTIPECIAFVTQRPLKYPILIQEILKNTKEDTMEFEGLKKALVNVRIVINRMNTLVTEYENTSVLEKMRKKLDPKLEWSYENNVIKIDLIFPKSIKLVNSNMVVFRTKQRSYDVILVALWTHMILLVEKDQKYTLLNSENPPIIPMQNLLLRTVATDKKAFFLVDKCLANMYEIVCPTVMDKTIWVEKINKHLKENHNDISFSCNTPTIEST